MKISHLYIVLLLSIFALIGTGCTQNVTEESNEFTLLSTSSLRIGTVYGRQTYYIGPNGPMGFEYELAKGFANYLNAELEIFVFLSFDELEKQLTAGKLDIVATGNGHLDLIEQNTNQSLPPPIWGPTYQTISRELVYLQGEPRPRRLSDLKQPITLVTGSSKVQSIPRRKTEPSSIMINTADDKDSEELLISVAEGEIPFTIANSNELNIVRRRYPQISIGFTLQENVPVAWQLAQRSDDSLQGLLFDYMSNIRTNGTMARLEDKYFGHVKDFDFVDTRAFIQSVNSVLPKFEETFKTYNNELDWRLLAALSYQESHWDPKAVSPTGVRGIMMLTQATANDWGVKSRLNAVQSIAGGAKYFSSLIQRIPARIQSPDRIWMALAAYNIGLGHVEDARVLTQRQGGNPDIWIDVKTRLPLLQQKRYYSQTRYGYARGNEALNYVENIRRYYDTLVWLSEQPTN